MVRRIKGRAQQVIHGRINDSEIFCRPGLEDFDACQENAGIADQIAARLEHQFQSATTDAAQDFAHVRTRIRRDFFVVADAEAATKVEMADRDAFGRQCVDQ